MFLRPKPKNLEIPDKKAPKSMVFALVVFTVIIFVIGLFPGIVTSGLSNFAGGLL